MKKIEGSAKSVRDLLKDRKYSIDYYQREYKWASKQMQELVDDLTGKFEEAYDPSHSRQDVKRYPYYFLGSIIVSDKDGALYIVDGQQRLTSLTLLLVFLRHLQNGRPSVVSIDDLIYSELYAERSFNINVPERADAMDGLFQEAAYTPKDEEPESVQTLVARYEGLEDLFPETLRGDALPYFVDWLLGNVQLVEITTYSDDDAYTIFETMNDRGLRLTPADMLRGFLLSNIDATDHRSKTNTLLRSRSRDLKEIQEDGDADFFKTWFRSQYSTKIRERKKNAHPEDWDRIGTEFHRWIRDHHKQIGLNTRQDFYEFVNTDFEFYSRQYQQILEASTSLTVEKSPLRFISYNADLGFTLQYQLLLAPLRPTDNKTDIDTKLELVGRYINILLAWRIWNARSTAYSTMQYTMFNVMKGIRGLDVQELAAKLMDLLSKETETFDDNDDLYLHQQNRSQLQHLLARMTDYITVGSKEQSNYKELVNKKDVRYEVEHIWANHYEQHANEFTQTQDFDRHRNLIGGLLLVPKKFNASYNDLPYEEKARHYLSQNLLARSLNEQCYTRNPGFKQFVKDSGLPFKPYERFTKDSIRERSALYRDLAKQVWNPTDLLKVAEQRS